MDFSVLDTQKIDEYAKQARERWGKTDAYKEFEQKAADRSKEEEKAVMENFMQIFADFGRLKDTDPASTDARSQVKVLQDYITGHFYQCTDEILAGLGQMYGAGGEFTQNIDRVGGKGTAAFTAEAIRGYVHGK